MFYSRIGRYCREQLENLPEHYKPEHYKYVQVPLFVVMPNHVHAVISVDETFLNEHAGEHLPTIRTALSVVIGGFKRSVTMYARRNNIEFYWQSRYHDHIIRGVNDGNKISDYILNNVYKWRKDSLYSEEPNNI